MKDVILYESTMLAPNLAIHFPVTFQVGEAVISAHLIFELLALQVAAWIYYLSQRNRTDVISDKNRFLVVVAAAVGALMGSRALAWLEHHGVLFADPSFAILFNTKTIVGAIIGATLAVELAKQLIGVKHSTGDAFIYPLIAGIIVGRIGCFLTGVADHTTGLATTLPWGLDQGDGVLRHPTALYEIGFLALLGITLRLVQRSRPLPNGLLFILFLTVYLTFRLAVDFIKPAPDLFAGMSAIQWACLLMLLGYCLPRFIHLIQCKEVTPITT